MLYGQWSSHMMQCRLQSSGLVSKVMRHGPEHAEEVTASPHRHSRPLPVIVMIIAFKQLGELLGIPVVGGA